MILCNRNHFLGQSNKRSMALRFGIACVCGGRMGGRAEETARRQTRCGGCGVWRSALSARKLKPGGWLAASNCRLPVQWDTQAGASLPRTVPIQRLREARMPTSGYSLAEEDVLYLSQMQREAWLCHSLQCHTLLQ